jgi:hypothetical protein
MTRAQYRQARKLIRANGYSALRWFTSATQETFCIIREIERSDDMLALRQRWSTRPTESRATIIRLTSFIWKA